MCAIYCHFGMFKMGSMNFMQVISVPLGQIKRVFFPPLSFQILTLCSVLVDFLVYYHFF